MRTRSHDPDAEPTQDATIRFWERLLVAAFGLMLVGSELPSRWDILTRAFGWMIVAAAVGLVELAMAGYYRARGWMRSSTS
jgi:hypothetical protein